MEVCWACQVRHASSAFHLENQNRGKDRLGRREPRVLGSSPRWGSGMSWGQCGHREVPGKGSVGERTQGRAPGSLDNVARYLITPQRLLAHEFPPTSPGACQSFFFF